MNIREATVADAERLFAFRVATAAERLPTVFERREPPSLDHIAQNLERIGSETGSAIFLALVDGSVVGCLNFRRSAHHQQQHCGSFSITVSQSIRGRGVGTKLIQRMLDWAGEHSIHRIELEVLSNNPGAIKLYERIGFQKEGTRRAAVDVQGELIDIIHMAQIRAAQ